MRFTVHMVVCCCLCVALSLLSGCGKTYTDSDVIGTWTNPDGGTLVFSAHTFTASKLPASMVYEPQDKRRYAGTGQWSISDGDKVALNFTAITGIPEKGAHLHADIEEHGQSTQLSFVIGDPDSADYYRLDKKGK